MFSHAAINEARIGFNFISTNEIPQESLRDSDIGISRPTAQSFPGLPLILLARDSGGASIGSSGVTLESDSPSATIADVISFQSGKESLRLGGEFRRYSWNGRASVKPSSRVATADRKIAPQTIKSTSTTNRYLRRSCRR